jgi:elongator complex protein 3
MRQNILRKLALIGSRCKCIRCREIKSSDFNTNDCNLFVNLYDACNGTNYFISYENKTRTKLYGFIRLRFNKTNEYVLPELQGHALIRELHIYGTHTAISSNINIENNSIQHKGLGKLLLSKAEEIAKQHGYKNITVISGVGVKKYYRRLGYQDYKTYLSKTLTDTKIINPNNSYLLFIINIISLPIIPLIFSQLGE